MKKLLLIIILFSGVFGTLFSQDPMLSQYYANPGRTNPALVGIFDGTTRIFFNYRDQLSSVAGKEAYRTLAASYDMRIPVGRYDHFGLGMDFMRDEAGTSNFNRIGGNFGGSYIRQLYANREGTAYYLVGAAQVGFGQWTFEPDRLWFSNQFDPISVSLNENAASGENFDGQNSRLHVSFNAGAMWYATFDKNASVYIGAAMYHINNPNIAFSDAVREPIQRRYVLHAGGEIPLFDAISLIPAVIYNRQGPNSSALFGAQLKYRGQRVSDVDMKIGVWGHASESIIAPFELNAIILSTVIESGPLGIGLSYDFTSSTLSRVNENRGALEVFLSYTFASTTRGRYQVDCPGL